MLNIKLDGITTYDKRKLYNTSLAKFTWEFKGRSIDYFISQLFIRFTLQNEMNGSLQLYCMEPFKILKVNSELTNKRNDLLIHCLYLFNESSLRITYCLLAYYMKVYKIR